MIQVCANAQGIRKVACVPDHLKGRERKERNVFSYQVAWKSLKKGKRTRYAQRNLHENSLALSASRNSL